MDVKLMSFFSGYHYLLNHNYGKVMVGLNSPVEFVAAYAQTSKMEHFKCVGEIEYVNARQADRLGIGYLTTFFGSPCYREDFMDDWVYVAGDEHLLAFVTVMEVSIVTTESVPFVITAADARFANLFIPEQQPTSDNVVYLAGFK
jgi:hypothetical protein